MSGAAGISSVATYGIISRSQDLQRARFEKQPDVRRDVERFRESAAKIKSGEDLLKDRRALEFVLTSFQLESEIGSTGILRKLLTQDISDPKALANRLADRRFTQLAQKLSDWASDPLGKSSTVDEIVKNHITNRFEKSKGEETPGLHEALYFKRTIGTIENLTIPKIMGDKALMKVVKVALGLPDKFAMLPYEQQKSRLTKLVDPGAFSDPKFVDSFVKKYLTRSDLKRASEEQDPILSVIGNGNNPMAGVLGRILSIKV